MSAAFRQLRQPRYGEITQGTVFSCAYASRYEDCEVHGLAITARCDVAHDKFPVLNYLPVVRLEDWLREDGLDLLIADEQKRQSGILRQLLKRGNVSSSLLQGVPLDQIATVHFPTNVRTKKEKRLAEEFRGHIELIKAFKVLIRDSDNCKILAWFRTHRLQQIEELIRRLGRHLVLGHYFFETLSPDTGAKTGHVCLLREVATLSRTVAQELGRGVSQTKYERLCAANSLSGLSFTCSDFAMPVAEFGSPTIEHVLQSFSNLFTRIGVAETTEDAISSIITHNLHRTQE